MTFIGYIFNYDVCSPLIFFAFVAIE